MEKLSRVMSEFITQAQGFSSAIQNVIALAKSIMGEVLAQTKAVEDLSAKVEARAIEVSARELAISKLDNIVKLEADGRELARKNKETSDKLAASLEEFEKHRSSKMKEITMLSKQVYDEKVLLAKQWDEYKKREVELKQREGDYKLRIAQNLVKGVEGK